MIHSGILTPLGGVSAVKEITYVSLGILFVTKWVHYLSIIILIMESMNRMSRLDTPILKKLQFPIAPYVFLLNSPCPCVIQPVKEVETG